MVAAEASIVNCPPKESLSAPSAAEGVGSLKSKSAAAPSQKDPEPKVAAMESDH